MPQILHTIKIDKVRGSFLEISSYPAEPTRNGVGTSRRLLSLAQYALESELKNETFKEGEICVVGPVLWNEVTMTIDHAVSDQSWRMVISHYMGSLAIFHTLVVLNDDQRLFPHRSTSSGSGRLLFATIM